MPGNLIHFERQERRAHEVKRGEVPKKKGLGDRVGKVLCRTERRKKRKRGRL